MNEPKIIYEDADVLALNKPAGLLVHSAGRKNEETVVDWLEKNYPTLAGVGETMRLAGGQEIKRPGIVHRLDKETSGVLLVAKNQKAFLHLKLQFQNQQVKKTYYALVYGTVLEKEGVINEPIGRGEDGRWVAGERAAGRLRLAVTEFKTLEHFPDYTFLEARPQTGRTHQLRVHFKFLGHPIVGDKLYAPRRQCLPGLERLALHAASIELTLPSGSRVKFEADLPDDFSRVLHNLRAA